ncbi:MAG TPA: GNAT family N-acetyltransferase [Candidatus Tumulicola sp.]|jgi:GNAT superfamily N-acetyltransferase
MASRYVVRRATIADCDALAPAFDAYREFFTAKSDPLASAAFLRERIERNESVVFGAFDGKRAVGFVQLYPLFSSWYAKRQWFLSDLFVVTDFRRLGVAARLLDECTRHARDTSARSILVELPFSEPHLVQLYEDADYRRDEVFALYRLSL